MRLANERLAIAERIGRADLQSGVLLELNDVYNARLETDRAHEPLALAIELAGTSGSPTTRGWILRASGRQAAIEGRLGDAEAALDEARAIFTRERRDPDARPHAELARSRPLGQARPPRRRGDPAGGDSPAQADPGPGDDRREPAPPGAGAARPGAPRGGGALRPRVPRDRRRRGRVVALDDAACARARPGGAGDGTTRPSGSCGSPRRSCGRPGSGAIRSRRSRRSPSSSARATATTRRSRWRRRSQRSSAAPRSKPGRQDESCRRGARLQPVVRAETLRRGREST